MLTLGLTGGMGAGKGWCAAEFARRGIYSIDTDRVSRDVTTPGSPCLAELEARFGTSIISPDGTLDRRKLASIAFADEESAAALNAITHKHILAVCRQWLKGREAAGDFAAIVDAPLLYESRFNACCDYVIAVIADTDTRIRRVLERDKITEEQAMARMSKQHDNAFFLKCADFIIYNNDDADPALQIDIIIQQLKSAT